MVEASGMFAGRGLTLLYTLTGTAPVVSVVWSPDGKWLAAGSRDETVQVWNLSTGEPLGRLEGSIDYNAVCWSPDGKQLAAGSSNKTAQVWEAGTGKQLRVLEGHTGYVNSLVWSPDGKWLASSSDDDLNALSDVRIWHTETWEPLAVLTDLKGSTPVTWHLPLMVIAGQRENDFFVWRLDLLQLAKKMVQKMIIYISSSSAPEDELLLEELNKQLSMLKRQPNVQLLEKRFIEPGENWKQEVLDYIHQAHLIVFLVSPDFLTSGYCYEEMEWAMRRKEAGKVSVIPVLMRHTASWQETPVGELEPLPADREPVSGRVDRERVMRSIAERIQDIAHEIRQGF